MSGLSGAHYLWPEALLNLDAGGRDLVLAQLCIAGFSAPPWEGRPSFVGVQHGGRVKEGKAGREQEEG